MTLFNLERRDMGIHNPFESPTVPLSSLALDSVFGRSKDDTAGQNVTEATAFSLPIFWRCVGLISTIVASCSLKVYRNPGKIDVTDNHPLLSINNQDTTYTQYELWELVVVHLKTWGNAYVLKVRDPGPDGPGTGRIRDLKPIHPSRVRVKLNKGNKVFCVKRVRDDGTIDLQNDELELTSFEIMHIADLGTDGVRGMSPIETFARTLGTAMAGDKLAAKFYRSGSMLSGFIKVVAPLPDQETADAIRNRWLQRSGGVDHAAEVAVLDAETTFQPLTIPPDQLQFLESRRWGTTEVARWFGIPPHLVGDVEKSTSWGTGIEQQNTGFVNYTINGTTRRIEHRFTREVISVNKQYSQFDLRELLRGDMQQRFEAYAQAINAGWMLRSEARTAEDMQPVDGLDEPLIALNMQTVKQASDEHEKAMTAPTAPPPGQAANDNPEEDDQNDN